MSYFCPIRLFELIASGSLILLLFLELKPDVCVCVCQIELLLAPPGAFYNCLMAIIAVAHNQYYCFMHRYVYINVLVYANADRELLSVIW